jgi:hypothetical protein
MSQLSTSATFERALWGVTKQRYSAEASTLQLRPGEFPKRFTIEGIDGEFKFSRREERDGDLLAVHYHNITKEGFLAATIFND